MAQPGSFIIVTGGDSRYCPLIRELVASLRALRPAAACPIGIIDAGLTDEQRAELKGQGLAVVTPPWPVEIPAHRLRNRIHLKANLAKLHLPTYFPGYETVIWIDADAWVQDWEAVELLRRGAATGRFAIVAQFGRFSETELRLDWLFGRFARVRSILFKNASRAGLSGAECRALATRPTLNAGAYALRADAPHWEAFQRWQKRVLVKGRLFTSDQLAMAGAIYLDKLPVELLPEWCNYIGPWRFDSEKRELVEYYLPNRRLGIVHLAGEDAMRADPAVLRPVLDMDDREHRLSLRYPAWADQPEPVEA
ncbi:glycosyltransferase [Azospirillum thermophilum]|uniref:Glycosyl transferase n=1 Tax=Azospirillum thermophilum TaxID=2202148 RepID=A0A2S2D012_9PROT|nr:glycosyltransferase [Azospirillum thermophilum]AWK90038.1 glycosyl transferase [Azospirillum thermophilum]